MFEKNTPSTARLTFWKHINYLVLCSVLIDLSVCTILKDFAAFPAGPNANRKPIPCMTSSSWALHQRQDSVFPNVICLLFDLPAEEIPSQIRYLVSVLFELEVSGFEQVKLQIFQVSFVRLGACGKNGIVLSTDDEARRLAVNGWISLKLYLLFLYSETFLREAFKCIS